MSFRRSLLFLITFTLPLVAYRMTVLGVPLNFFDGVLYVIGATSFLLFGKEIVRRFVESTRHKNTRFFWIIYALYALGSLMSIIVSQDTLSALGYWRAYVFNPVLVVIILNGIVFDKKDVYALFYGYMTSATLLIVYGVWEALSVGGVDRVDAIFESPNYLALFIAPAVLMSVYAVTLHRGMLKIFAFICLSVATVGVILTSSRGAVVSVLFASIIASTVVMRSRVAKIVLCALLVVGVAAIYGSFRLLLPDRQTQSDSIRISIMRESIEIALDYPVFGVGLGDFQTFFAQRTLDRINFPEYITPHARTPHNLWLNAWIQTGLLGLVSMAALIWYGLSRSTLSVFAGLEKQLYIALVSLYFIYGLFEAVGWKNDLAVLFWTIFALPVYWRYVRDPE